MKVTLLPQIEAQDHVASTVLQKLGRFVRRGDFKVHPNPRIRRRDIVQEPRNDPVDQAIHGGHADMTEIDALHALHIRLNPRLVGTPALCQKHKHLARWRKLHPARLTVEQADPQALFDKLDLPVDRGRRDVDRPGGRLDRAVFGDGFDVVQAAGHEVKLHLYHPNYSNGTLPITS